MPQVKFCLKRPLSFRPAGQTEAINPYKVNNGDLKRRVKQVHVGLQHCNEETVEMNRTTQSKAVDLFDPSFLFILTYIFSRFPC